MVLNSVISEASKIIFITGSHRSGTSWVGKMLATGGNFLLRDEEIFNCVSEIGKSPIQKMYLHISQENEKKYSNYINNALNYDYPFLGSLTQMKKPKDFFRIAKRKMRSIGRMLRKNEGQILIEPIGFFSAEWFSKKYHTPVVLVVRHPASFVSSLKKLNWGFDFNCLLTQKELMEYYLKPYESDFSNPPRKPDVIGIGILLWKAIYGTALKLKNQNPDWIFVKLEDLSVDPIPQFQRLFSKLNLPFNSHSKQTILEYSSPTNPVEFEKGRDHSKRNSRETIGIWKNRLTPDEINRIKKETNEISSHYYHEQDW